MQTPDQPVRPNTDPAVCWVDFQAEQAEPREDRVRNDLKRRLKGVCEKLSEEEFDALIERMTREQLRGETGAPPRTRPS